MIMKKWTEQEIIDDLIKDDNSKKILENKYDDLILLHHSLGRYIRNNYKLWEHDWVPQLENGVDMSPNHPDAISQRIIVKLYEHWLNKETLKS